MDIEVQLKKILKYTFANVYLTVDGGQYAFYKKTNKFGHDDLLATGDTIEQCIKSFWSRQAESVNVVRAENGQPPTKRPILF